MQPYLDRSTLGVITQGSGRDHEQGGGAGLRKLDFFRFGLFFNSKATDTVLVTLPSTAVETAVM